VTPESAEVVIIGSGFAGGVAAMRLTQAGIPVTLVERGRRWDVIPVADQPFCLNFAPDGRAAWLSEETVLPMGPVSKINRYVGLIERVRSPNLDIFCGAAYGGTSVVTGMLSLVPRRELFEQVFPRGISYDEMATRYYPRAQRMLGASTIPDDILASETYGAMRVFKQQAAKAGLPIKLIPTATDWDVMRRELRGEIFRCGVDGELIYGNNSGCKLSVDRTYLAAAEATGRLTVLLQHRVTDIARRADGRYLISIEVIDEEGRVVEQKALACRALFVCAGCYWTNALFVRARAKGLLPELDDEVGAGFGNNGNVMYLRDKMGVDTGPNQGGPPSLGISFPDNPYGANFVEHPQFPAWEWSRGKLLHFSLCINPTRGRFVYDAEKDKVVLEWPADGNAYARSVARYTLERLNDANGGELADDVFIRGLHDGFTYHPLGGMVMGKATDLFGRVKGYPGLYTLDGSLIPGSSAAVNPSLTITANAERCIEAILAEDRLN
jgi:cholesterol oxidase